jgi:galactonate dehydratase
MAQLLRRDLLKIGALGATGAIACSAASDGSPKATVRDIEIFRIRVNKRGNWTILRLQTSAGVTGLGDASQSGNDAATVRFVHQFLEILKGRSIYDVEWFRDSVRPLVRQNGQPAAVAASALEHCLWDIRGQVLALPAYQFFGGRVQDRIRVYANINRSTDPRTPDGFASMATKAIDAGFDAVKLAPFDEIPKGLNDGAELDRYTQRGLDCGRAVREAIGPKRDLLIDVHSKYDLRNGIELAKRCEPLKLFWLEEVTPADPIQDLASINRIATMPTAGGETVMGVDGFYRYITAGAVDIIMPDVKVCGGMLELFKIAAIAEGAGLQTAPHGPASPVGNVVAAHVCATLPNFLILEFSYGEVPWRAELIEPAEVIADSALPISERPGLGIQINEKIAAKYAV